MGDTSQSTTTKPLEVEAIAYQPERLASSVRFVNEVGDLATLFDNDTNVVCLRRSATHELINEAQLAGQDLTLKQFILEPVNPLGIAKIELPDCPHLAADLAFFTTVLADLTGAGAIGVRLQRTTKAMCPRFHVDRVTVRFVVTYSGPATEFIASEHVDRQYLGHTRHEINEKVGGLLLVPDCIQQAEPFELVALKGENWPQNKGLGAVHRSPSVEDGLSRLVVTLDPL